MLKVYSRENGEWVVLGQVYADTQMLDHIARIDESHDAIHHLALVEQVKENDDPTK
jgi:hypothetical protein